MCEIIAENLAVCMDCIHAIVNDDFTGLQYSHDEENADRREKEIRDGIQKLSQIGYICLDETRDMDEFSVKPCECCGERLAGTREYLVILK